MLSFQFQVQVALKCLSKEKLQSGTQEFLKEAGIMQTIDHENIVHMFGVVLDKDNSMILVSGPDCIIQTIDHENIVHMFGVVLDKDNSMILVSGPIDVE